MRILSRKGDGLLIFLLFFVLIIGLLVVVIYVLSPREESPVAEVVGIDEFSVYLHSNAFGKVNYELSYDGVDFDGVMFPGVIEKYDGVVANTSLLFGAWNDDFYYGDVSCFVNFSDVDCDVFLDEMAKDFVVGLNESVLFIDTFNRTLRRPVLCFSHGSDIMYVDMDLPMVGVPVGYKSLLDVCFVSYGDVVGFDVFDVYIKRNFLLSSGLVNVSVFVFDSPEKYGGVGQRNFSFVV